MKRRLTVSSALTRGLLAAAAARGFDVSMLLVGSGLAPEQLADRDGTLPAAAHLQVWARLVEVSGDEHLGLHLSESIPRGAFGLREYVLRTAPTIGAAIEVLIRYQRLLVANVFQLVTEGDLVRIEHAAPKHLGMLPRHTAEFMMSNIVLGLRGISKVQNLPREVWFQHPSPASIDEHRRVFGCSVLFEQPVTALTIHRSLMSEPIVSADASLHEVLVRQAEAILAGDANEPELLNEVRQQICASLKGTKPALTDVAKRMGVSSRSLQRRLSELGTTYQELLDGTCREIALHQVREQRLSIAEITFLLGYSEVSAFHHAFRRWTGVSPARYRRAQ